MNKKIYFENEKRKWQKLNLKSIYQMSWLTRRKTNDWKSSSLIDVLLGDMTIPDWLKTRSTGADVALTEKTCFTAFTSKDGGRVFQNEIEFMRLSSLR